MQSTPFKDPNIRLLSHYRDSVQERESFFEFTPKVFSGADFKKWYDRGGWGKEYIPYSLFEGSRLISNVSVSEMQILVKGQVYQGLQFATVGTLAGYRKKGYSKFLMEKVLSDYRDKVDFFFLFANETVLGFYPKFGFKRVNEHLFETQISPLKPNPEARKLNLEVPGDLDILKRMAHERSPITRVFGAIDYNHILLWHCLYFHQENLWYLPDENIVIVLERENNKLIIFDILSSTSFSLNQILQKLPFEGANRLIFYFTPEELDISAEPVKVHDDPFFVMGDLNLEGKPFKFPALAQT